jgi:adenosylhomocysteine nucleosidase
LDGRSILVALIGMGTTRARENTQTIFQYFRPKALILAGYGGALVPQLKVGQVVVSNNFSSEEVQSFLRLLSGFDFANFCTVDEVIGTPVQREWQARKTQAQVVDMETAVVAEVIRVRSIPFTALRVISDDYQQVLPTGALAAGFDPVKGRATPLRLLMYLAFHPSEIGPFQRFVLGLSQARKNLTTFLRDLNNELPSSW